MAAPRNFRTPVVRGSERLRVETENWLSFSCFFSRGHVECQKRSSMKLPSVVLALVASVFVIGCAKEPPPTPAESALEKKDKREYNSEVEGRIR
jgi:hypothetical protein